MHTRIALQTLILLIVGGWAVGQLIALLERRK